MSVEYIIVQAGGKGTRLEHLTMNKPKALVPVENLPMLFHLFRQFPNKRYIVIADYKREVLREYLWAFAEVQYQVIDAEGTGTCGGIKQALDLVPDHESFMLIWSDLVLPEKFEMPSGIQNYIGISQTFSCRWKYENCEFTEEQSSQYGVAGVFIFKEKSDIEGVPLNGEFVRYLKEQGLMFASFGLNGAKEFGTLEEYKKLVPYKTRPFNRIVEDGNKIIKEPLDSQGKKLARFECKWYAYVKNHRFSAIPEIYKTEPLVMEKVAGKNIYEYTCLTKNEKLEILRKLTDNLKRLHEINTIPADAFSLKEAYFSKTIDRLSKIRDLIPFAENEVITVNGRNCRNIYFYKRKFEKLLDQIICRQFTLIHGDCTFSNIMLRNSGEPVFIDPRGYFGYTELYGDPNYDWAKLYYSIIGNYDRFNLRDFRVSIGESSVELNIPSNQWEELEREFFVLSGADERTIRLLHAVLWLSLTTYAWQDYDSICGAFYNGLYYLEECWQ